MECLTKTKPSSAERIRINREKKKEKRREQKLKCYRKQQYRKISESTKTLSNTSSALRQRAYNERKRQKIVKENERKQTRKEYMKKYRRKARLTDTLNTEEEQISFSNRMDKARSIRRLREALPQNPSKRAAVLSAYVDNKRAPKSPGVEKFHSSFEESVEKSAIQNVKEMITSVKQKRNKDATASLKILTSAVSGQNISNKKGAVKSLANKLGVKCRTIQKGKRIRTQVLKSDKSSFLYTARKTRSDSLSEATKKHIFNFWLQESNSRPTNNTNDMKRVRLGPRLYSSHPCHILEKTQTEVFLDFKKTYPDLNVGQRAFEKCKPYFVRTAHHKDKLTCCCRQHVEMRCLFKTCMQFRKKLMSRQVNNEVKMYESLTELVDDTLCPRSANTHQHNMTCLNRECNECGVGKLNLLPEELEDSDDVHVSWERYEYQNVKIKGDKIIKKLILVKKSTSPADMFQYFKRLLETFPAHQYRAYWQSKQMKSLVEYLPIGHCIAIHDFSENYKCTEQCEIQSSYFQKQEVSLHVTIIHRHSLLEYDGKDSTENDPNIVTEHFIVISPEQKHDHHFTNNVQKLLSEYLRSISYDVSVMHEFTDGCSAQYKSRHCMGDISYSCADFGYAKVFRNYFETSHARGPQDAAGGFVKKQADLSVIRGSHIIQSARDLFEFAQSNLSHTTDLSKCSRRIFKYIESVNRDRDRYFHPVKENRKIHQICSSEDGRLQIRKLSCYTCGNCIAGNYTDCLNDEQLGKFALVKMNKETENVESDDELDTDADDENIEIFELITTGTIFAVKADDKTYPYYLVRACRKPVVLRKPATDRWGMSFPPGSNVVHGYYFGVESDNPLEQKLIRRIPAIVPALSVIYICSEIEIFDDGFIRLDESLHRRILRCLD